MSIVRHCNWHHRGHRGRRGRLSLLVELVAAIISCSGILLTPNGALADSTEQERRVNFNLPAYDPNACVPNGDLGGTTTSSAMIKVDTGGFTPDPQAVNYFNKTSLPLIKKYISSYQQAAQQEGVPQNWEILAALHGPESGYSNSFDHNFLGTTGPSGPYQETASELKAYLGDPTYGPTLKTLVNPDGTAIHVDSLSVAQFVTLSRLVFKIWVSQALGSGYAALKTGPIPFDASVSSNNTFWKIMNRWNAGDEPVEGFNGFDSGPHAYPMQGVVWPGAATTYYLLKNWEAGGGVATVAGSSNDCTTTASDASSGNLIMNAALRYTGIWYKFGGAHEYGAVEYKKLCPDPSNPPNNVSGADANGNGPGNPSVCAVDCSSLISLAIDDAYHQKFMWTVNEDSGAQMSEPQYWQSVTFATAKPGDIVTTKGHVEFFVSYNAAKDDVETFGAHHTGTKVGQIPTSTGDWLHVFHYIGPTS